LNSNISYVGARRAVPVLILNINFMFQLSPTPLENIDLRKGLDSKSAGAYNCFEGWVRDHNNGKEVVALEYEAYDALCEREAQQIVREVREKFDIIAVKCVHRTGKLAVGDMAVWVGVIAAHRENSFAACRYIIDEVKLRLPIWKKEYYANGDSGWVACESCASHKSSVSHSAHR